jgi:hypothetical protein
MVVKRTNGELDYQCSFPFFDGKIAVLAEFG